MKSGRAVARLVMLLGTVGICTVGAESGAWAMDFSSPQPCPTIRYHSAPSLDAQRACMNLDAPSRGAPRGTYLFLSPGGSNGDGAGIFQDNGALVWWQPAGGPEDHDMAVVHFRGQPYLALWSGRWTRAGNDRGDVSLYNEHYRRVGVITAGRPFRPDEVDLHEFRITPQGDALIGIWDPVTTMVGGHPDKVVQYVV